MFEVDYDASKIVSAPNLEEAIIDTIKIPRLSVKHIPKKERRELQFEILQYCKSIWMFGVLSSLHKPDQKPIELANAAL